MGIGGRRAASGALGVALLFLFVFALTSPVSAAPKKSADAASCPAGKDAITDAHLTVASGLATGTFSVAPGCSDVTVSLASYETSSATFSLPQTLFKGSTNSFSTGGPYSLTVDVPSCYYQVDLVFGDVIETLDSAHLYAESKLAFENGGTSSCAAPPPPATCPANAADDVTNASLVIDNGMATGTFDIAPGCKDVRVSLASYKALSATFALPQTLFDSDTGLFSAGGPYTLHADVPDCYYQVDLVRGPVIETLTSTNLYYEKKLAFSNGGTACTQETPGETVTQPVETVTQPVENTAPEQQQQSEAPVSNVAAVSAAAQPPQTADVAITKVADTPSLSVGDDASYTITVTNTGEATAADVTVAEDIPAGLTFVSATPSVGSCSAVAPVVCSLGSLAVGASATIKVVAHATVAGTLVNTATVSTSTPESNAANNTANASVTVQAPFTPPTVQTACVRLTTPQAQVLSTKKAAFSVRVVGKNGKPAANVRVRAHGSGISAVARTNTAGIARFAVKPRSAGAIAVSVLQSGTCAPQQQAFQVLAAEASSPEFTG